MRTILTAAATLLTLSVSNVQASTTNLIAFGDSLSDSGNIFAATLGAGGSFPTSIYPEGQFTNGDAWTTQLGLTPSLLGGTNYSYGGARAVDNGDATPDLLAQIRAFVADDVSISTNTAATIWAGGNDFLALPASPSAAQVSQAIEFVVRKIGRGVSRLSREGISEVLVFGLPDFGLLPQNAGDPAAAAGASFLTQTYNSALEQTLAGLDALLVDTNVSFFDTNSFYQDVISMVPAELVSVPCLADPAGCAANPENYALYDDIHPSEWVHALLADAVSEELGLSLNEVPLPASGLMLLAGIGGLGAWSRRRKSHA